MVREILRVISSPGSTRLSTSVLKYVVLSTFFKGVPSLKVILLFIERDVCAFVFVQFHIVVFRFFFNQF